MVLAHARPFLLRLIAEQLASEWPDSILHITMDRPTPAVTAAAASACALHPNAYLVDSPMPALTHREQFMELRQWQLEQIMRLGNPEYCTIWDDDHILESPAEHKVALAGKPDLVYISKAFFWSEDYINARMPDHHSPFWFRTIPGDRYPVGTDRMIHAPVQIHDGAKKVVHLVSTLLDVGYVRPEDRERVFKAYARVGKIDAATRPLVEPPQLVRYRQERSKYHDKLREIVQCL